MVGVGSAPLWLHARAVRLGRAAPRKKILVAIFQRGAADGLNMVVPHGEKRYYELRPTIAIPRPRQRQKAAAIDLDGFFGLHPSLAPLKPHLRRSSTWRLSTRSARPTPRARTSTRRTIWSPARPG